MKLTREQVYALITDEGNYASSYDCGVSAPPDRICDNDKPLELWLLWMQSYLNDACNLATKGYNKVQALHFLRIVLSLGVNAAMRHGLPEREG